MEWFIKKTFWRLPRCHHIFWCMTRISKTNLDLFFFFFFENPNVSTRADRLVTYLILLTWKRWRFDANVVSETLAALNPFPLNVPFSSPLKTSQTKGFLMFSGGSKGNIGKKRVWNSISTVRKILKANKKKKKKNWQKKVIRKRTWFLLFFQGETLF